jgi:hypothetical protein
MGGSQTGLVGTIGVTLLNPDGTTHTARTTTGLYEIGGGCYGKNTTFDDDWKGSLKWDTGGGSPVYAVEEYNYLENNPLIDAAISGRAPANEYDTQMGYIPSNLGDVPTATELIAAHGSGAWTTADVSALATSANVAAVPAAVWDEILTGATHNIATSAGRRVREIGAYAIHSGTAQAGNSHSITLAAAASPSDAAYNGIYNRNLIVLTDNTGVGQTRTIVDYDAVTKIVVVDRDWRISPDATTEYQITPDDTPLTVDHGVAQGGTARTITIRDYASSVDDAYLCNIVTIIAGTGRGQARLVGAYDGTTKIVTICGNDWVATPDTTSIYVMMPYGATCVSCIAPDVLRDLMKTAGVLL